MIKVVYCLKRKEGMTRAEFQEYWIGPHAAKVKERANAIGMTRYVQSHTHDTPMKDAMAAARGGLESYDGIMEGWWDSEEAAIAALTSADGSQAMAEVLDDEGRFIDFSRSPIFVTQEHVVY